MDTEEWDLSKLLLAERLSTCTTTEMGSLA